MLAALRAEGLNPKEHPGWRTHNRNRVGAWGPVNGVLIHHTAGVNSLSVVYSGRSDLPGPLAHAHLAKDGTLTLVGNGRANHAGKAAKNAFDAVVAESKTHPKPNASSGTIDGNARFYGIEIENLGNSKDPYPAVQYDAAVRWAAAICRAHGWGADSVVGHKETSIEGKIDPSFDMDKFRADVAGRLAGKPSNKENADMPKFYRFERKNGVTLRPEDGWYTVTFDRYYTKGKWHNRDLAQTTLYVNAIFVATLSARVEGLEPGQEVQVRFARNIKKNGKWQRGYNYGISSPVHDGGSLHLVHTQTGEHPGSNDARLVCEILPLGSRNIRVDKLSCDLTFWEL